jgi:2-polyprenyl-3-methyl-5-hydroxy-6-metoxy-1,4-benzoquinol methylase
MASTINLQEHLAGYDIHYFGDRRSFEKWAEQKLGHRWRQRLGNAYAGIHTRNLSHEDVRKTFDSSAHTKFAQVNLSSLYATEFALGEAIEKLITGRKRVLDLGCNIGHLTTWYARTDTERHVTGVDFSLPCIHAARSKAKKLCLTNVEFQLADIEACDLSGTYDAIVESNCLKYVKDIRKVLSHLASLLEPNGILVTTHATLGTNNGYDRNSLLQSADLVEQHMQSATFFYLGRKHGCSILVARKQTADCAQKYWNPQPCWNDPATSQVILVGA